MMVSSLCTEDANLSDGDLISGQNEKELTKRV
jgi:hypothetical protein